MDHEREEGRLREGRRTVGQRPDSGLDLLSVPFPGPLQEEHDRSPKGPDRLQTSTQKESTRESARRTSKGPPGDGTSGQDPIT